LRIFNPVVGIAFPRTGSLEVTIDTGFDGVILVPERVYKDLQLFRLEKPVSEWSTAETLTGEELALPSSSAIVELPDLDFRAQASVETFSGNIEYLIGMGLLEQFVTIIDGRKRESCLA
jgi:predicted aspartyl protease